MPIRVNDRQPERTGVPAMLRCINRCHWYPAQVVWRRHPSWGTQLMTVLTDFFGLNMQKTRHCSRSNQCHFWYCAADEIRWFEKQTLVGTSLFRGEKSWCWMQCLPSGWWSRRPYHTGQAYIKSRYIGRETYDSNLRYILVESLDIVWQ